MALKSLSFSTVYAGYTFATDQLFSLAAGSGFFQSGSNTIELRGQSVNNVWDAFWLDAQVGGRSTSVPEPTTMALLLAGFGLLGSHLKKRRQEEALVSGLGAGPGD